MMEQVNEKSREELKIRPAGLSDKEFILSLLPRLVEFGPPSWRNREQMTLTDTEIISRILSDPPQDTEVLIAEDSSGIPLGFIHLNTAIDYYTRERHGHISDIAVAESAKGQGAGNALMKAAEEWTRSQGYRILTLNVFKENHTARRSYEKFGFNEEIIKYIKILY